MQQSENVHVDIWTMYNNVRIKNCTLLQANYRLCSEKPPLTDLKPVILTYSQWCYTNASETGSSESWKKLSFSTKKVFCVGG